MVEINDEMRRAAAKAIINEILRQYDSPSGQKWDSVTDFMEDFESDPIADAALTAVLPLIGEACAKIAHSQRIDDVIAAERDPYNSSFYAGRAQRAFTIATAILEATKGETT